MRIKFPKDITLPNPDLESDVALVF